MTTNNNTWSLVLLLLVAVSQLTNITARHHHIKFRHERHRRQHAEGYLPSSFVPDTTEPETGLWGPWSSPSSCSRSCGGGVAHQTRRCLDTDDNGYDRCSGPKRRFFSCNIQPCQNNTMDFRAEQCAEFNNVPFEGVVYDWIPYTGGPNKCELNCMPRGERFFYRHKLTVIDGTPCDIEKNDVCVEGKCMPVGCDMMLGSDAREDACRECGGDGSNCNTVKGLFDTDDLQVGYIDILLIPEGATNIVIKEIQPSNNYLAIRNTSGHYYLNGNWRIDFPRSLRFAGTICHYARDPQGFSAPDTITAQGPTTEAIYIVLLYQDHNVGVQYEYSIPKKFSPVGDPDSYTWIVDEFSECSVTCGGGYKSRRVNCVRRRDNEPVDESLCDPQLEPDNTQACNDDACPPEWIEGEWSSCSKQCGEDGEQTRSIKCEQIVAGGIPTIIDDSICIDKVGPKNETTQECNKNVECPKWHTGPWKPCDHLCGAGKQTRKVTCFKKNEAGKIEVLEESACDGEVPEKEKPCELRPCAGLDWVTSDWTGCDEKCGLTQETRTAHCATNDGTTYPNEKCDESKKPVLCRPCEKSKSCEHQWYTAQWSDCSAKCGKGVQTRKVFCGSFEDDVTLKKVEDDKCDPKQRYNDTQDCQAEVTECKGEWFAGPWSKCTKECGGGDMTRKVICMKDNMTVPTSNCDAETIMFSSEECNKNPCSDDDVIPVDVSKPDVPVDNEDDCLVYEDEEFVTFASSLGTDETGATEESSSSSSFGSTAFTMDNTMMSDSTWSRGDISPETGSGVGSGDGDYTILSSIYTDTPISSSELSTIEGSGSSSDDDNLVTETTGFSVSGETFETTDATSQSSVSSATNASEESEGTTVVLSSTESSTGSSESSSSESSTDSSTPSSSESSSSESSSESSVGSTASVLSSSELSTESSTDSSSTDSETTTVISSSESSSTLETTETTVTESTVSTSESTETTSVSATESSTESTESSTDLSSTDSSTISETSSLSPVTGSSSEMTTDEGTTVSSEESSTIQESTVEVTTTSSESSTEGSTESLTSDSGSTDLTTESETGGTSDLPGSSETSQSTSSGESTDSSAMTTEGGETTETGETSETGETTESGMTTDSTMEVSTMSSETSETGMTTESLSTDEDETEKSSILDLFTTVSPIDQALKKEQKMRKCKVRKPKKSCRTSEFNCCYDGVTPAQGPFGKGCPTPSTCSETQFGCCPDTVSVATGPKNEGCPSQMCEETLFGCCQDGKTPAEGNDFLGCKKPCNETEFGCCPDNETAASGENKLGCCNVTEHGCCPDGIKPATGPNSEGCEEETTDEIWTDFTNEYETTTTGIEEDCANTTFGCCPDGHKSAVGTNFEGCGVINTANCTASYFGCCPDNVTSALGGNEEGCHGDCVGSTYGCCQDKSTPAHGPNGEGCCLTSPYGCCPDNILPARGPDFYGCGCEYSRFRCCPDNTTAARGPENEGCGCQYTTHGCCPNRFTPATGPNYEGCPCYTYQFGCCPDGLTIAKGPHSQGCGCENTEHKCCSDGRTPAKGANFAGCTCDASKFGCCPDGIEEAQGDNFEGCLTVPVNPGAACGLERDRGSCRDFTVKWFFDTEYGGCSRFWYGGCDGNDNRFKTQEECKEICVAPSGRDACHLPKSTGPCEGYYPTWYYDNERKQCGQFIYGGCLGNANKFKSREECEQLCAISDDADPCEQEEDTGPCQGNFTRWYFNKEGQNCQRFKYGGCKGNNNNFLTESACQQKCLQPGHSREQDSCLLPALLGECHNYTQRWYYDSYEQRCRQFYYGGCGGNENNFISEEDCLGRCSSPAVTSPPATQEFSPAMCFLPDEHGPCSEEQTKWFYDSRDGICKQFTYGGCSSNGNKFESREECEYRCGEVQDACSMPKIVGPCSASVVQYYYERRSDTCEEFAYSGCSGNRNRFQDRESCESKCKRRPVHQPPHQQQPTPTSVEVVPSSPICSAPADAGPCRGDITAYYYDSREGKCQAFIYGGCEGNANRFQTEEQCERLCGLFKGQDLCNLPVDSGPCRGSFPKYYYDRTNRGCRQFFYGGCDGNANRFSSQVECESVCIHREEPATTGNDTNLSHLASNEIDVGNKNESKDPCVEAKDECDVIRCPYGKEAFVDDQDCERCRCVDPCRDIRCPPESRCSITPVTTEETTEYRGVCRSIIKPGRCPVVSNSTRCERECSSDADCSGEWKCCDNGCGTSCLEAASEEPVPTPPPVYNVTAPQFGAEPAAIQRPKDPRVSGEEGGYVTMTCFVTGNPRPTIIWRKDSEVINPSEKRRRILGDGSLQIINLYRYDAGIYICVADNGLAPADKCEYKLEVTVPVAVNVTSPGKEYPVGSEISIGCSVDGYPIPKVLWYKDGDIIRTDGRVTISESNRLIINNAGHNDTGKYLCEATNEFSTGYDTVEIQVAGIYIHPDCQDNSFFAKCDLIVKAKYCQHQYYAKFCCRSCTEAGQLPISGEHLRESNRKSRSVEALI